MVYESVHVETVFFCVKIMRISDTQLGFLSKFEFALCRRKGFFVGYWKRLEGGEKCDFLFFCGIMNLLIKFLCLFG
jgi:hypothetical protein